MPDNQTWDEIKAAGEILIYPVDGVPITSEDHRTYNLMMLAYSTSFNDFTRALNETEVIDGNIAGILVDARLVKRIVSKVIVSPDNTAIAKHYIEKPFLSDTLKFKNGMYLAPHTIVTISFEQDPTAPQ